MPAMYQKLLSCVVISVVVAASLCTVCADSITGNAARVMIDLYYEAMCPYCRKFITTQLYPVFTALTSSILDITIYPYGWGRERMHNGSWQFACQHGPAECLGNIIATCAMNATSYDPDEYMPFINCMESNTKHGEEMTALSKCTKPTIFSEQDIVSCIKSPEGGELQHEMAVLTRNVSIQYTPWILVNGVHTDALHQRAYTNLLHLVCETYTGSQPDGCKGVTSSPIVG